MRASDWEAAPSPVCENWSAVLVAAQESLQAWACVVQRPLNRNLILPPITCSRRNNQFSKLCDILWTHAPPARTCPYLPPWKPHVPMPTSMVTDDSRLWSRAAQLGAIVVQRAETHTILPQGQMLRRGSDAGNISSRRSRGFATQRATASRPHPNTKHRIVSGQVSPRKSSMMRKYCLNCGCCGSSQLVQQQLKSVATLSGQLHVHLASYPKHQIQGHPPTVQTQPSKD